MKDNMRRRE